MPGSIRPNPYVGPRPFTTGETLYGRDLETRELVDLLIAERIVLIHAPSGAGKSSLIQAALIPSLTEKNFQILPVVRVNEPPPADAPADGFNRYVYSALQCFENAVATDQRLPPEALYAMSLPVYVDQRFHMSADGPDGIVLIFDQFEEIVSLDPTDQEEKVTFFMQVGQTLRNRRRWALFSLRSDYKATVEPYALPIPTRLENVFSLSLLEPEAAHEAIQQPARDAGVDFVDSAVRKLVDDLRQMRVQRIDGSFDERPGPTVEPMHLQVVSQRLWEGLPEDAVTISEKDVIASGDVDAALGIFYDERVAKIAAETGVSERSIRDWCEYRLITDQDIRSQVPMGVAQSGGLDNRAISHLVAEYLVRAEKRHGATWYDLAHDRLIAPIRKSNAAWRTAHMNAFQRSALEWERLGRPSSLLLHKAALTEAEHWETAHQSELTPFEVDYLGASRQARTLASYKTGRRLMLLALVTVAIIVLIIIGFQNSSTWRAAQPWAYAVDLATGTVHQLTGDFVSFGRSTEAYHDQVDLLPQTISRLHFLLLKSLTALDARSLNGTTVNGVFLQYGSSQELKDRDIVVLAGLAPFEIRTPGGSDLFPQQPAIDFTAPLSHTWAMLIDGNARQITPLSAGKIFLSIDEKGRYVTSEQETNNYLMRIAWLPDVGVTVEDRDDGKELHVTMKENDYDYNSYPVPPDQPFSAFNTSSEEHDLFEVSYNYDGKPFQIVRIVPDLEGISNK